MLETSASQSPSNEERPITQLKPPGNLDFDTANLADTWKRWSEEVLQCDAFDKGLGAVLTQMGQPIAYASRALTDAETRYAKIEKELLAVVFGLEKFHHYTYGRLVRVQSDHKPLEVIVKKPIHKAPKRLQRMLLRLLVYDIDLTHRSGKKMQLAETLSRAYLPDSQSKQLDLEAENINMTQDLPVSAARLDDIRIHTRKRTKSYKRSLQLSVQAGLIRKLKFLTWLCQIMTYATSSACKMGWCFVERELSCPRHSEETG